MIWRVVELNDNSASETFTYPSFCLSCFDFSKWQGMHNTCRFDISVASPPHAKGTCDLYEIV